MSVFEINMDDILNDPATAADGANVLKQLETSTPVHPLVALTSIAVSLTKIAVSLSQINQTLHTGNLGQGENLRAIKENTDRIGREVASVNSSIGNARSDKQQALQRAIMDVMNRV